MIGGRVGKNASPHLEKTESSAGPHHRSKPAPLFNNGIS